MTALSQSSAEVRAILREIEAPGTGRRQFRAPLKPDFQRLMCRRCGCSEQEWKRDLCRCKGNGDLQWTPCEVPKWRADDLIPVREAVRRAPHLWIYAADETEVPWPGRADLASRKRDRLPAPFVPLSCSRITLIVTEVRVERVQDISEEAARAEGWPHAGADPTRIARGEKTPIGWHQMQWDHQHGPDAWGCNPWVAAVTFRPILANIDAVPSDRLAPEPPGASEKEPKL